MDEDTVREQEGGKRRDIRMKREERKGKREERRERKQGLGAEKLNCEKFSFKSENVEMCVCLWGVFICREERQMDGQKRTRDTKGRRFFFSGGEREQLMREDT